MHINCIYIYIYSSGFTSYFTTPSVKNSITAEWLRIAPIKFVNSEKNTFLLLLIFSVKAL